MFSRYRLSELSAPPPWTKRWRNRLPIQAPELNLFDARRHVWNKEHYDSGTMYALNYLILGLLGLLSDYLDILEHGGKLTLTGVEPNFFFKTALDRALARLCRAQEHVEHVVMQCSLQFSTLCLNHWEWTRRWHLKSHFLNTLPAAHKLSCSFHGFGNCCCPNNPVTFACWPSETSAPNERHSYFHMVVLNIIQCFPLQPLIAVSSRNSMARSTFGGQQARKNGDN